MCNKLASNKQWFNEEITRCLNLSYGGGGKLKLGRSLFLKSAQLSLLRLSVISTNVVGVLKSAPKKLSDD